MFLILPCCHTHHSTFLFHHVVSVTRDYIDTVHIEYTPVSQDICTFCHLSFSLSHPSYSLLASITLSYHCPPLPQLISPPSLSLCYYCLSFIVSLSTTLSPLPYSCFFHSHIPIHLLSPPSYLFSSLITK